MQQGGGTDPFAVADGLAALAFLLGEMSGDVSADDETVTERDRLGLEDRSRLPENILRRSKTARCGDLSG